MIATAAILDDVLATRLASWMTLRYGHVIAFFYKLVIRKFSHGRKILNILNDVACYS